MKPALKLFISLIIPLLFTSGCVSTVIGVTAGAAVSVAKVAVTAPIEIGSAAVRAAIPDDEDD